MFSFLEISSPKIVSVLLNYVDNEDFDFIILAYLCKALCFIYFSPKLQWTCFVI